MVDTVSAPRSQPFKRDVPSMAALVWTEFTDVSSKSANLFESEGVSMGLFVQPASTATMARAANDICFVFIVIVFFGELIFVSEAVG